VLAASGLIACTLFYRVAGTNKSILKNDCGGEERWDIKILADKDASKIDFGHVRDTTIRGIGQIKVKKLKNGEDRPRSDVETRVYRVCCKIVFRKHEDDKDYHLVLYDPVTKDSMIAEMPDYTCPRVIAAGKADLFKAVADTLSRYVKGKVYLQKNFEVTGVIFQDFAHKQKGHAPNYLELHPILSLRTVK
jgi:hypothetical protein